MSQDRFPGMSWEELEVKVHQNGHLMFPCTIRRRGTTGEVTGEPVMVRIPSPADKLQARAKTLKWMVRLELDPKEHPDIRERCEDLVILALSIRHPTEYSQFEVAEELAAKYDESSLRDIKERIAHFEAMLDPREPVTTEEEFWTVVGEISEKANLLPLADIVGHEQPSFILRMALELWNYRTKSSGAPSTETSTPEP